MRSFMLFLIDYVLCNLVELVVVGFMIKVIDLLDYK